MAQKMEVHPPLTVASDLDSVNMRVCRVCLAINVKMYHMSENLLNVMYEKITGIQINTEDKLPKMLCWECVARLSSANNFREKASKTHQILMTKLNSGKFITMSDIESIDKALNQLESTLNCKHYKVNDSNFHIIRESTNTNEYNNEITKDKDVEFYEIKTEIDTDLYNEEEIKIEENEEDSLNNEYFDTESVSYKEENVSDEEEERKDIKRKKRKHVSEAPMKKRRSKTLPCIEVKVEEPTQEHFKQFKDNAHSSKETEILPHLPIKKETLFGDNNFVDTFINSTEALQSSKYFRPRCEYNPGKASYISVSEAGSLNTLFICNICHKQFEDRVGLKYHIERHTKPHACSYCSFRASNKFILNAHINTKHTKKTPFICDYCQHETYTKKNLISHINFMHLRNVRTFRCSYCSFTTTLKCHLATHVNAIHTKNVSFNCSLCDFKTYQRNYLKNHVNAKHTKKNSFDCPHCDYKAFQKTSLKTHINAKHTKTISYDCPYCEFKTFQKGYLATHVKSKHTKETCYNCSYCDFKTYLKSSLKTHINTKHTKEVSYDCSYCDFKTYLRGYLKKHVDAKHPDMGK